MAVVYQIVAVKEIKGVFQSRTDAKRTLRELVILRQCNHSAIVKLLDVIQPTSAGFSNLSLVFPFFSMDISQLLNTIGIAHCYSCILGTISYQLCFPEHVTHH
jgi:serine/threonine protein kinase